jgi:hypothetical protein
VVEFTIGSRGKVPGKTWEKRRRNNNNNNNNNNGMVILNFINVQLLCTGASQNRCDDYELEPLELNGQNQVITHANDVDMMREKINTSRYNADISLHISQETDVTESKQIKCIYSESRQVSYQR